jgi:galactose-1-phosphate uridylyltransferase
MKLQMTVSFTAIIPDTHVKRLEEGEDAAITSLENAIKTWLHDIAADNVCIDDFEEVTHQHDNKEG